MDHDPYPQAGRPEDAGLYPGLDEPTRQQASAPPPRPPQQPHYVQPAYTPPPATAYDPAGYPAAPPTGEDQPQPPDDTKLWMLRAAKGVVFFIYLVVAFALGILALSFTLQAFGANPQASFAEWVYRQSSRLMEPFRGIFPTKQVSDTSVLDFSLLFAMVVYAIVAMLLHALVSWLADRVSAANRTLRWQQQRQEAERRRQEDLRYRAQQASRQRPQPGY